jgi:hypothetical protein
MGGDWLLAGEVGQRHKLLHRPIAGGMAQRELLPIGRADRRPATYRVSSAGASSRVSFPGLAIA